MKIETHIVDLNLNCSRCGISFPPLPPKETEIMPGDHIGIISELKFTENSAYRIRKTAFDSNQLCLARPSKK